MHIEKINQSVKDAQVTLNLVLMTSLCWLTADVPKQKNITLLFKENLNHINFFRPNFKKSEVVYVQNKKLKQKHILIFCVFSLILCICQNHKHKFDIETHKHSFILEIKFLEVLLKLYFNVRYSHFICVGSIL